MSLRDRSSASKARLASSLVIIAFTYRKTANVQPPSSRGAHTVEPVSSDDNCLLPEQDLGFYTPAVRAVELVDSKVAASWMLLDNSEPYWLATSRAVIIHKKIKRQGESPLALGDGATE